MKKQLFFVSGRMASLCMALCASLAAFTSCDDSSDDVATEVVTFEDARLSNEGVLNNETYIYGGELAFVNVYNPDYLSWNGFALSNNTDKETIGYANQYSVYADGGANGSDIFAVCYYSEYMGRQSSRIEFTPKNTEGAKTIEPVSARLALTTYTYLAAKEGKDGYYGADVMFADKDYMSVSFCGYNDDVKTDSISFDIIRNLKFMEPWTSVDLTPLGKVNKIFITIQSSKRDAWGLMVPSYVALDDFSFRRN